MANLSAVQGQAPAAATAAPPTTPQTQGSAAAAAAQQALQGPPATVETTLTPASSPPKTMNAASMDKHQNANLYHFTKKVRWQGENYILKLDFPCPNWRELQEKHGDEFKDSTEAYAELFLADLIKRLDASDKIQPGENFEILFDEDNGYTIFVAPPGYDPFTAAGDFLESIDKDKKIVADFAESKKLSEIISSPSTDETQTYSRNLRERLDSATELDGLRKTVSENRAVKATTKAPVNLEHRKNNCFINSAFQYLVNDSNPEVAKALRDPKNYNLGKENAFYKAVMKYDAHKRSETNEKCDISKILKLQDDYQGDATLTVGKFSGFFIQDKLPQALKSVLEFNPSNVDTDDQSLQTIISARDDIKDSSPESITIYTPRMTYKEDLSTAVPDELKISFTAQLESTLEKDLPTTLSIDALKAFLTKRFEERSDDLTTANLLFENPELFAHALNVLAKDPIKKEVNEARAEAYRQGVAKKNTPIKIDPDGKVAIGDKDPKQTYTLSSFIAHSGKDNNGHYVTYMRKGDKCWLLDDMKDTPIPLPLPQFIEAARVAVCYRLHKDEAVTSVTDTTRTKKNDIKIPSEGLAGPKDSTKYSLEQGEMALAGEGFTLVNPSDKNLNGIHLQMGSILDSNSLREQVKTAEAAKEHWWNGNGALVSTTYNPRRVAAADMLLTNALLTNAKNQNSIIHIPLRGDDLTEQELKAAVTDVLTFAAKNGKFKIAFPVLEGKGTFAERIKAMREAMVEFQKGSKARGCEYKIIGPEGKTLLEPATT